MITLLDIILAMVVVEGLALTIYHRRTGSGLAPRGYGANLGAGFCLLLTARLALTGASPLLVSASLFAALCAHVTDLAGRWPRRGA